MEDYTLELDNRRELSNGSVKYDIELTHDETGEQIFDTTYTVSKQQEDPEGRGKNFKEMVENFARKKAREHEKDLGHDHSGESIKL